MKTIKPLLLAPNDPHGFLRHLEHRKEAHYQGDRVPEDHDYYARISDALKVAEQVVILSHGKGKSNTGEHFVEYF